MSYTHTEITRYSWLILAIAATGPALYCLIQAIIDYSSPDPGTGMLILITVLLTLWCVSYWMVWYDMGRHVANTQLPRRSFQNVPNQLLPAWIMIGVQFGLTTILGLFSLDNILDEHFYWGPVLVLGPPYLVILNYLVYCTFPPAESFGVEGSKSDG